MRTRIVSFLLAVCAVCTWSLTACSAKEPGAAADAASNVLATPISGFSDVKCVVLF